MMGGKPSESTDKPSPPPAPPTQPQPPPPVVLYPPLKTEALTAVVLHCYPTRVDWTKITSCVVNDGEDAHGFSIRMRDMFFQALWNGV